MVSIDVLKVDSNVWIVLLVLIIECVCVWCMVWIFCCNVKGVDVGLFNVIFILMFLFNLWWIVLINCFFVLLFNKCVWLWLILRDIWLFVRENDVCSINCLSRLVIGICLIRLFYLLIWLVWVNLFLLFKYVFNCLL